MSKSEIAGTCGICNEEVFKQEELRFVDDVFYCPGCFEEAVVSGKVNETEFYDEDYDNEEDEEG